MTELMGRVLDAMEIPPDERQGPFFQPWPMTTFGNRDFRASVDVHLPIPESDDPDTWLLSDGRFGVLNRENRGTTIEYVERATRLAQALLAREAAAE